MKWKQAKMSNALQVQMSSNGRRSLGGEALVYHCNFYNYWLQKTVLLVDGLDMGGVIHDAAAASAYACLKGLDAGHYSSAEKLFAKLGFGLMDLSQIDADGGTVTTSVSHYGQCLSAAAGAEFARPQSRFDAGFAAGASAWGHGRMSCGFEGTVQACMSLGASEGKISLRGRKPNSEFFRSYRLDQNNDGPVPPKTWDGLDQAAVDEAVARLQLVGNEEGLIPRFGVMLTQHFAHFYNRLSFEFLRRMGDSGMRIAGEHLLLDAGYRCAFHTFGGVFLSPEWESLMSPVVASKSDAAHAMASIASTLGWGRWRLMEVNERRAVMRVYDDYESLGYRSMYGQATRPVSFLAAGGLGGLMNLLYLGDILSGPELDSAYFEKVFEHPEAFTVHQTQSIAMGHGFSEIVAER
jgi:hypothetical protein